VSLSEVSLTLAKLGLRLVGLNIVAYFFGKIISWLFSAAQPDFDFYNKVLYYFFLICVGLMIMAMLLAWLSHTLSLPIKYCRDVFNYLGDTSTRTLIQEALDKEIAKMPRGSNVAVLSHSLGSVIAVDSMTNRDAWAHLKSVVLVTGGSPIRRWFQSFFPCLLFSVSADDMLNQIRCRTPLIGWINVFREHDPVGGALGFTLSPGVDQSSDESQLRGLLAHQDYWNSAPVHEVVRKRFRNTQPLPSITLDPTKATEWPTESKLGAGTKIIESVAMPTIRGTAVIAVVFSLVFYFQTIPLIERSTKEFVSKALISGHQVPARVTHRQVWVNSGVGGSMGAAAASPEQKYVFDYKTVEGQPRMQFEFKESRGDPNLLFDSEKLLNDFRSNDDNLDEPKTFSVTITYLDDDQSRIAIPDYPPTLDRLPWWFVAVGVLPQLLFTAVIGLIAFPITMGIAELLVVRETLKR
jgi:hypothetical protein